MKNLRNKGLSRRELVGTAAAVAAFTFVPKHVLGAAGQPSANNKLNIAGTPRVIPEAKRKEFGRPPKTLPRSPGHHQEWIDACKAGKPQDAQSGFWYAGPFVEALHVGNLAVRLQKRVEWDAATMRSPNCPEADNYITKFYRNGWNFV